MRIWLTVAIIGILALAGCNVGPLTQLNNSPSYEDWEGVFNPGWESAALQNKVIELAQEYRDAHGQDVCWNMARGFSESLDAAGITYIIGVTKGWVECWGERSLILQHVYLIVLGRDGLIIPIERARPIGPNDYRFAELTTGYFYRNFSAFEAEYPYIYY